MAAVAASLGNACLPPAQVAQPGLCFLHVFHEASWGHPTDLLADSRQHGRKGQPCGYVEVPFTSPLCVAEWNFIIFKPTLCNLHPHDKSQQKSHRGPVEASNSLQAGCLGHHEESQQR